MLLHQLLFRQEALGAYFPSMLLAAGALLVQS